MSRLGRRPRQVVPTQISVSSRDGRATEPDCISTAPDTTIPYFNGSSQRIRSVWQAGTSIFIAMSKTARRISMILLGCRLDSAYLDLQRPRPASFTVVALRRPQVQEPSRATASVLALLLVEEPSSLTHMMGATVCRRHRP